MKLLVLSPVFPDSPCDGDRLRLFHWLRHLTPRHKVTLACFADPERNADWDDSAWGRRLSVSRVAWGQPRRQVAAALRLASALPLSVAAEASTEMQGLVDSLLERGGFDAVLAYRLKMAPYALRSRGPRFLDYTDSLTRYAERRASGSAQEGSPLQAAWWRRQAVKLAAYEAYCAAQFNAGFFNAVQDRDAIAAMAPQAAARLHVAANGAPKPSALKDRSASKRLLFVGNLAYAPNVQGLLWFAQEVLPLIRAAEPQAQCSVLGSGAPPALKALDGKNGLRLEGFQSDLAPWMSGAAVGICPLLSGAGRQNKLLEALAAGLPSVATPLAAEGAQTRHGRELLVAGSAAAFAQAVLKLLREPALGRRLAAAGQALARQRYDWRRNAAGLETVMTRALSPALW